MLGGHPAHCVEPGRLVSPTAQVVHWSEDESPSVTEYFPPLQGKHVSDELELLDGEYVPAGHSTQVDPPSMSLYPPGGHAGHVTVFAVSEYAPLGQRWHAVDDTVEANVPM